MVAWSASTYGLPPWIIVKLQQIATLHKTDKEYNKGLYTHGGLNYYIHFLFASLSFFPSQSSCCGGI